jgi:hypothetical protein
VSKNDDPHHATIGGALRTLVARGARLCFTSQTLGEFWNASTRPLDKNGFGLSVEETDRIARVIERDFELLPDAGTCMTAGGIFSSRTKLRALVSRRGRDNWYALRVLFEAS